MPRRSELRLGGPAVDRRLLVLAGLAVRDVAEAAEPPLSEAFVRMALRGQRRPSRRLLQAWIRLEVEERALGAFQEILRRAGCRAEQTGRRVPGHQVGRAR